MIDLTAAEARLRADCGALGAAWDVHEHAAVFTVEDSAAVHVRVPGAHTKNLFLKDHRGRFWLATIPADARADLKRMAVAMGSGRLSFGRAEDMARLIGVSPGSVTPLAAMLDTGLEVTVALDAGLMARPLVAVHPLRNTATVALPPAALLALLRGWRHEPVVAPLVA